MSKFNFKIGDTVVFRTCSSIRDDAEFYVDNFGEEVHKELFGENNLDYTVCHGTWKVGTYAARIHDNHIVLHHDTVSETIYEVFVRSDAILPFNELSKEFTMDLLSRGNEDDTQNGYRRKVKNILIQSSIDVDIFDE